MKDKIEYNKLVNQKKDAQSRYNAATDRIEECEYLLRRLRAAKGTISLQKGAFRTLKNNHKNIMDEKPEWEGNTYTSFKTDMGYVDEENECYFKYTIDNILDALNDEITRIENKKLNEYGLLGQLGSLINSLANKIENYVN